MIVFRLAEHNPLEEADILSSIEKGDRLREDTPENRRNAEGLSVHDSREQSLRQARSLIAGRMRNGPPLEALYIAEINLPDNDPRYSVRRTYP